jgi:RNA polymerase sigma-70 factor (ECF subfamily)
MTALEDFQSLRPLLFSIAYRMLGSAMEAEDILQEAFLRYENVRQVESPRALLTTIVTRLCLNQLNSAQAQREVYIGPWLPEPILTENGPELDRGDSISLAFLVLLENLSPAERAAFLLREVFDYDYDEIARVLERSEDACRQLFSRARKHISDNRPRFTSTPEEHRRIMEQFLAVTSGGDMDGLLNMLADDVTVITDGGGKAVAAIHPVRGRQDVARFMLGVTRHAPQGARVDILEVNGRPGIIIRSADGVAFTHVSLTLRDGKIVRIHAISNPDKLKRL